MLGVWGAAVLRPYMIAVGWRSCARGLRQVG